jgi:pimeloyl-[acyl-carrier protein] methyl ester esterase
VTSSLVLLPGLDGSGDQFAPLIATFGGALELTVVRYPNAGAVDFPAHVAAARSALPTNRPYVLLGESFSGPIAIRIAAAAPAGLVGLILCASFAQFPRPALRFLRPLSFLLSTAAFPVWLIASFVLGGSARPPLKSLLARSMREVAPEALRSRVLSVFDIDARQDLAHVRVPILYLRATRDRLVPASAAQKVAAIARQTVVADIDAPHFVLQAAPVEAARAIRRFMGAGA